MVPDIVIVQNSRDEIYMHQRKETKKIFPSLYGIGAGGKVDAGETPRQAAQRELQEELGVTGGYRSSF